MVRRKLRPGKHDLVKLFGLIRRGVIRRLAGRWAVTGGTPPDGKAVAAFNEKQRARVIMGTEVDDDGIVRPVVKRIIYKHPAQ